jgi:hypothetical protein
MLLKLIKYDLKSTYAKILLTFLIFIVACIAAPLLLVQFQKTAAFVCAVFTGGLGCTAMYVLVMVFVFMRYHSNLYAGEGYLMFSLPTDGKRLLTSKLLVAVIWFILAYALLICGLVVMFYVFSFDSQFAKIFTELFGSLEITPDTVSCALVSGMVGTVLCILDIYFSISVSKLPVWRKCGVLMGFVTYFAVGILHFLLGLLINGFATHFKNFKEGFTEGFAAGLTVEANGVKNSNIGDKITVGQALSSAYSWKYEWENILISSVFCVLLFIAITWLLNRKTNLK